MDCRSLFIDKDKVVLASIDLACVVGDLEEAVALNQVSYWIEKYKETNHNFKDGKYWVYNSYKKWHDDNFPFWHTSKIQRIFKSLEKKGLLISANYNSAGFDKTKWYSIDYKKLQEMMEEYNCKNEQSSLENENTLFENESSLIENEQSLIENEQSLIENEQSLIESDCPIPGEYIQENTTEDNNRDYSTENTDKYTFPDKSEKGDNIYTSFSGEKEAESNKKQSRYIPDDYTEEQLREHIRPTIEENYERIEQENELRHNQDRMDMFEDIVVEFYRQYEENMGVKHRIVPDKTLIRVMERYINIDEPARGIDDLETYEKVIGHYFNTDFNKRGKHKGEITLCLSHFMNNAIVNFLMNREGILWERYDGDDEY